MRKRSSRRFESCSTARHLDARCGEFDCECDAVEPPAHLGDDRRILVGEREASVGGPGAFGEERNGAEGRCLRGRERAFRRQDRATACDAPIRR